MMPSSSSMVLQHRNRSSMKLECPCRPGQPQKYYAVVCRMQLVDCLEESKSDQTTYLLNLGADCSITLPTNDELIEIGFVLVLESLDVAEKG